MVLLVRPDLDEVYYFRRAEGQHQWQSPSEAWAGAWLCWWREGSGLCWLGPVLGVDGVRDGMVATCT